jgi:hypothetical protein
MITHDSDRYVSETCPNTELLSVLVRGSLLLGIDAIESI